MSIENTTKEQKLLLAQLEKMGVSLVGGIGITLGDNPGNVETVARELRKSLERLESGDFEVEVPFDQFGEPTYEKVQKDLAVLAGYQERADEIQNKVIELRRQLGRDLMAYAENHLRPYTYGKHGIEDVVDTIVQTAGLEDNYYDPNHHFWLPSNFGC